MSTVRIEGVKELTRTLTNISPAEGRRIARRTVTSIARDVRDTARSRLDMVTSAGTGNLRRSLKSRQTRAGKDEAAAQVYADTSGGRSGMGHHWHLVEYGTGPRVQSSTGRRTGSMPATPYITPSVEEWRGKMPRVYQQRWWNEYEREMLKRGKTGPKVK